MIKFFKYLDCVKKRLKVKKSCKLFLVCPCCALSQIGCPNVLRLSRSSGFGDRNLSAYREVPRYENASNFRDARIALARCYRLAFVQSPRTNYHFFLPTIKVLPSCSCS